VAIYLCILPRDCTLATLILLEKVSRLLFSQEVLEVAKIGAGPSCQTNLEHGCITVVAVITTMPT
jgi:hypothetical protein